MADFNSVMQFARNQQLLERLPVLVTWLMVILLAATLARVTWLLIPDGINEVAVPATPRSTQGRGSMPVATTVRHNLAALHLFGNYQARIAPPLDDTPAVVPETRLNLTLKGVLASTEGGTAKAIIADAGGNEDFYSVGAAIPGGAQLEEIHEDHVILRRNNQLETLRLPDDLTSNPGRAGMPLAQPQSRTATRRTNQNRKNSRLDPKASTGEILKTWQGKLEQDPQELMSLVRAEPVERDGRLVGYRIRPNRDRSVMRKFGLRPGDIVTGVNGMALDNPLNGLEIINNLKTASQVSLEIERNGSQQTFTFDVDG